MTPLPGPLSLGHSRKPESIVRTTGSTTSFTDAEALKTSSLSETCGPANSASCDGRNPGTFTELDSSLIESYGLLCEAAVDFERDSSTLRSNSATLALCRKLFMEDFPALLQPLPVFLVSLQALERLGSTSVTPEEVISASGPANAESILRAIKALQSTCRGLYLELDRIEGKTSVKEYFMCSFTDCFEVPLPVVQDMDRLFEVVSGASSTATKAYREASHTSRKVVRASNSSSPEDARSDGARAFSQVIQNFKDPLRKFDEEINYYCVAIFKRLAGKLRADTVKQGLRLLVEKQEHSRTAFMDFATIAIFFASMAATTLQFSYLITKTSTLWEVVNICWFTSVTVSIASAMNSLLGIIIHQSPEYLLRSSRLDHRILQAWFKYSPPVLLTIAGVLFLVGACTFTYSSDQGRIIQMSTATLMSTNFLALLIMSLLAFTTIIHSVGRPTIVVARFVVLAIGILVAHLSKIARVMFRCAPHVAILLPLGIPVIASLPSLTLYYQIFHRRFPRGYEYVVWGLDILGLPGRCVFAVFVDHWVELRSVFN